MSEEGCEDPDYSFSDGGFGLVKSEWLCAGWFGGYRVWGDIESLVEEVLREQYVFFLPEVVATWIILILRF